MAVYGMYNSPTKSITSGKAFASMIDPNEAELPTPMAASKSVAIHEENIGTAKKTRNCFTSLRKLVPDSI
jgi:hypothetical protein